MNDILYKNPLELDGLISNTYILAVVTALVFVGLSMLISKGIAYEGGKNPQDSKRRKIWFWITGLVAVIAFFVYNFFVVKAQIVPNPMLTDKFLQCVGISTALTFVVYVATGFILSRFVCKNGKYGTIFPSK